MSLETEPPFLDSVRTNVAWLRTMLPASDGSAGVWERLRLSPDGREVDQVMYRVRPDCSAEVALLFIRCAELLQDPSLRTAGEKMYDYILAMGMPEGTFPFYRLVVPDGVTTSDPGKTWGILYPNDHGKFLELIGFLQDRVPNERFGDVADGIARHLLEGQSTNAWYGLAGREFREPCFTAWAAIGIIRLYERTQRIDLHESAVRAVSYLQSLQMDDGRMATSYEVTGKEPWRPASSETAESLRVFALAHRILGIDVTDSIAGATVFLDRLTTEAGAIRNCDATSRGAALQDDPALTDLVYTDGYALHAWLDAADATGDPSYVDRARHLASFLAGAQCEGENPRWEGAWRGSYDVDLGEWRGRADQQNPIDEGGAYSVYTGWTSATISSAMLRIIERQPVVT